jgi:hypothetical protein
MSQDTRLVSRLVLSICAPPATGATNTGARPVAFGAPQSADWPFEMGGKLELDYLRFRDEVCVVDGGSEPPDPPSRHHSARECDPREPTKQVFGAGSY